MRSQRRRLAEMRWSWIRGFFFFEKFIVYRKICLYIKIVLFFFLKEMEVERKAEKSE